MTIDGLKSVGNITQISGVQRECASERLISMAGIASKVDFESLTFALETSAGPYRIVWSATTIFSGITKQSIEGERVVIRGRFNHRTIWAHEVHKGSAP